MEIAFWNYQKLIRFISGKDGKGIKIGNTDFSEKILRAWYNSFVFWMWK